jgi:predicted Fe-Mo cluster-binding NifX family protein
MRIAISSTGKDLTSNVSSVFGRADYFIIIDTEAKTVVDILDNSEAKNSSKGAGIIAASFVAELSVDMIFSGKVGPTAAKVLEKSLILTVSNVSGPVCEVIDEIYRSEYKMNV